MELIVCEIYKLYMKKGYKNVVFLNCGIFIDFVRLYLVVSLDFIVLCLCCGDGVVEFKCLMILKCEKCIYFCYCKLLVFLYCERNIVIELKLCLFCLDIRLDGYYWKILV